MRTKIKGAWPAGSVSLIGDYEYGEIYARDTENRVWKLRGAYNNGLVTCNADTPTLRSLARKIRKARYIETDRWILFLANEDLPDWAHGDLEYEYMEGMTRV